MSKSIRGNKNIIEMFRFVAENVPAYKKIVSQYKLNSKSIRTLEEFKENVPILDKGSVFGRFKVEELCVGGKIKGMKSAFTSSGFSNKFACGITTKEDARETSKAITFILKKFFKAGKKNSLIINTNAMGVVFDSEYPLINTSVRSDMAISLLKTFKNNFKKFIIVGDPHFIKKLVEDGKENNLDWKSYDVLFAIGGDWTSDSLAGYIASQAGCKKEKIFFNMGMTEFGLNLFNSSPALTKIRSIIQKNYKLRRELFLETQQAPEVLYYYPQKTFAEIINPDESGIGEIVLSNLNRKAEMPLIRYKTGDLGKLMSQEELKKIMKGYGYKISFEIDLPVICVFGRNKFIKYRGRKITAEEVKEAVYRNKSIASKITGLLRLNKTKEIVLEVQLKKGVESGKAVEARIKNEIFKLINFKISVRAYEYEKFPNGTELDYEKKFRVL